MLRLETSRQERALPRSRGLASENVLEDSDTFPMSPTGKQNKNKCCLWRVLQSRAQAIKTVHEVNQWQAERCVCKLPHLHRELLLGKGFSLVAALHLDNWCFYGQQSQYLNIGIITQQSSVPQSPTQTLGCVRMQEENNRQGGFMTCARVAVTVAKCNIPNTPKSQQKGET